jgi:hypothetical protein
LSTEVQRLMISTDVTHRVALRSPSRPPVPIMTTPQA